jgi:hypothetical protein
MGSVTLRDTVEKVGDASISTVEYVFSDIQDFLLWESSKRDAMNQAVKSFVDSQLFGDHLSGESPFENEEAGNVTEIKVAKKKTEPTKH